MTTPSPFMVARDIGNNLGSAFKRVQDENAIEGILSQAMNTGNPEVIQSSIGKILSQVSPERQGAALQYLQGTFANIQKKKEQEQQFKREKDAGLVPGINPTAQAKIYGEQAKSGRLAQYGLGGQQPQPGQMGQQAPSQYNLPNAQNGTPTTLQGGVNPTAQAQQQAPQSVFKRLTDDQLVVASGAPDKEVSEPAKSELKRRVEERKIDQKKQSDVFKSDLARSDKVKERADQIAEQIPQKRTALNLMKDAVANRNLSFFSPDNLAELTGIEGLRSPEGAIFKTAGKEYFLGNIARAGARPNQWIEQQISDMMAKIGRSPEANFSVFRALENELDLDEERIRLTAEISDRLTKEGDLSQGKLGSILNKELSQYAEKKQDILFNDLRAIKAIAEKEPQRFRKVEKGTKVSDFIAQALLQQFNNDPKKAAEEAKKLGYEF